MIGMTRASFQVLVYPYRKIGVGKCEYMLLKRSDAGYWQGVAGGGENDETPLEAAKRETREEIGLPEDSLFVQLITVLPIPVAEFRNSCLWGESTCVIPQYCFGVLADDRQIVLSSEHTEYRWLECEEALSLMKYEGNKIVLWELNERLTTNPRSLFPR
jgi:dATP pyrophosphohydrolase